MFVVCLSISLVCVACAVMFCSCVLVLVCTLCLWCVVLLSVASMVCRACMRCCCVVFVFVFCYGLNVSPVRDCRLYVPYVRCYLLFV